MRPSASPPCRASSGFHVYIAYHGKDVLYVGQTGSYARRMAAHRSGTPWWGEVDRVETHPCADRQDALRAEALLIRVMGPRYNVRGQANGLREFRDECLDPLMSLGLGEWPGTVRACDPEEPYGPLVCDCDVPATSSSDYGMCSTCKRKPLRELAS